MRVRLRLHHQLAQFPPLFSHVQEREDMISPTRHLTPETLTYAIRGRPMIPSDGKEHIVTVAVLSFEANTEYVSVPRVDPRVYLHVMSSKGDALPTSNNSRVKVLLRKPQELIEAKEGVLVSINTGRLAADDEGEGEENFEEVARARSQGEDLKVRWTKEKEGLYEYRLLLLSAPLLMLHSKLTTVTHISSPHSGQFPPTASTSSGPLVFPSVQTAPGHPESDVILVPFHGLTQCLTYTLIEVLWKVFGWRVEGLEGMARLPEYRSGMHIYDPL
ncbi:hypothetical protein D9756_002923 [Leucocoprinus leucothites]|uniref:Uncharacterized protein n=1 Tax=Leucocoprinus leucothites TaxID=201217 RepID=A0A8H5G7M4_9AGAR|nr:hypothetical protein D9756_002923 [Leucoagaricus leucothites]